MLFGVLFSFKKTTGTTPQKSRNKISNTKSISETDDIFGDSDGLPGMICAKILWKISRVLISCIQCFFLILYFFFKFTWSGLSDDDDGDSKPTSPQSTNTINKNKQNKRTAGRETTQFDEDVIPSQKATSALDNLLNGSAGTSSPKKKPTMLEKMMAGDGGSVVAKDKRKKEKGWYWFNLYQILH